MQLTILTRQIQTQLIGQFTAGGQRLPDSEPLNQTLQPHGALCLQARGWLAGRACRDRLALDRSAEQTRLDGLCAQAPCGVVAEISAELLEGKLRLGNLQFRIVAGEIHDDPRSALAQRDLQVKRAAERTLPLPAGEQLGSPDRRLLQQLQGVRQAAVDLSFHRQLRHVSGPGARYLRCRIPHLAVEDPPFREPDTHPTVFDQHLAAALLQQGPAGLKRQLRITHLEVQAQGARAIGSALVQCALVLEITLLDRTAADRLPEPVDQRRAQRRRACRQVFFGEARIAFAQADPQVHVILCRGVPSQSDEKISGDLAFLAVDAQIGRSQREGLLIQRPGQAPAGVSVVPRLGIKWRKLQAEVVAVHAQLAAAQVTTNAATRVPHRRYPVLCSNADAVQIGSELQALRRLHLRVVVELQVAQCSVGLQRRQRLGGSRRQRRQCTNERGDRRDSQPIRLQAPVLLGLILLKLDSRIAPALAVEIECQPVQQQPVALLVTIDIRLAPQVLELNGLTIGKGHAQLRRVQP